MSDIDNRLRAPIRYRPWLDADEAETTEGLIATIKYITDKTLADCGHALRGVHAKSHGTLEGYLEVDADLPGDLAQGMFAKPGRYTPIGRLLGLKSNRRWRGARRDRRPSTTGCHFLPGMD